LPENGRTSPVDEVRPFCRERSSRRFERVECAGRVHQGCAGIDADADTRCVSDLLPGGAELLCCRGMNGDTAVAAQRDRDGKRDQFAGLGVKMSGLRTGTAQRCVTLDGVRRELANLADEAEDLVSIIIPKSA